MPEPKAGASRTDWKDFGAPLEVKLSSLEVKSDQEDDEFLTISGYGAVFGNVDSHGDVIMPGAFKDSLATGRKVKMLWQHDPSQPIGAWDTLREDENGLYMSGRISKKAAKGGEIAALVKMGAIEGLSIGYRVFPEGYSYDDQNRKLTKLDLWETSVVTFPSNEMAGIYAMKSEEITERQIERSFKDMGYSNRMAKAMASGAWKGRAEVLRDADATAPDVDQRDVDELKKLINDILQKKGPHDE